MQVTSTILWVIFYLEEAIIAGYILIPFLSLTTYGIAKLFRIKTPFEKRPYVNNKQFEFGLVVTAHQETTFITPLVDSILKQNYGNFFVYVVADDCDISTLSFPDKRVVILQPEVPLHSKIKSIQYAMEHFKREHDAVIIFDVDNLIDRSFLKTINAYFQKGYRVVQSYFKPKNSDTLYEKMDAIGDMFNFFVEREARMVAGLSSTIWGSGVAIDLKLYKDVGYKDHLGGFDKKLQSHLVQTVDRIAYAPDAILYDEKITSGASLETQRTRWIHSYFKYFKENTQVLLTGLKKMDFNLIYFGINILRPPLFIVLGIALLFTAISFFVNTYMFIAWVIILTLFFLSFAAIVLIKGRDKKYFMALLSMPLFAMRQAIALIKSGRAKRSFLRTEHTRLLYIEDMYAKEGKK